MIAKGESLADNAPIVTTPRISRQAPKLRAHLQPSSSGIDFTTVPRMPPWKDLYDNEVRASCLSSRRLFLESRFATTRGPARCRVASNPA